MPRGTLVHDPRIGALIDEAQRYSNPSNQDPSPPSITYPLGSRLDEADEFEIAEEERGGLFDRVRRPPWFEPVEHVDDRESQSGEWEEVPIIVTESEVTDPTDNENSLIAVSGIDAFAYYAPFHFYRRSHWGIYVRDYGIVYLASRFLGKHTLGPPDNWALRCAYWLLLEHEYFHFQTEIASTRYEMLTGDLSAYEHIFHDGHASWLEESMANARAHRHLQDHEDALLTFSRLEHFRGFASGWMKTQPSGYKDFDKWCRTNSAMQKGRAAITRRIHEISCHLRHARLNVSSDALRLYEKAEYSRVPIVRVHDSGIPWLKSASAVPQGVWNTNHGTYPRASPGPHSC